MDKCIWTEDDDPDWGPEWYTSCKHDAYFVDTTPQEEEYKYCPWCGKEIEYGKS